MILDLGCGNSKTKGALGIDLNRASQADIICDLNRKFYPFQENTFDSVVSKQVFEHLASVATVLEEIHRISKAGAKIIIQVPHFSCYLSYADPTHRRAFSIFSFDVLAPQCGFKISAKSITFHRAFRRYGIHRLANLFPRGYERFWAFLLPAEHLYFELQTVK